MGTSVMWFRRDLRLADNPALLAAAADGRAMRPLFVLDPALYDGAGAPRQAYLLRSLRALDDALAGHLLLRRGDPVTEVLRAAREVDADEVHIAADYGVYGARRDAAVEDALAGDGRELRRTGSPYAVAPGRIRKPDGTPYRVFTPFFRAWLAHGWRQPAAAPAKLTWAAEGGGVPFPDEPDLGDLRLPDAGEKAALARWAAFADGALADYANDRNRPDRPGSSRLSPALKYGELHPRTLLAELAHRRGRGAEVYRGELCWREFYADVLHHQPRSAWESLDPAMGAIQTDSGPDADAAFAAWAGGRTGYPIVDAGMRQLRAEGWMHNRVRMITASFLVKDLHLPWQRGAAYFLRYLVDGDVASNSHGWQWTAGTGTDAAPYVRVFNPTLQGSKVDPNGEYVRRWVPELRDVPGGAVHEPWKLTTWPAGYPEPIVDHHAERREALRRYETARGRG
jgi:deoxyribodipyrimidine photo-lyase